MRREWRRLAIGILVSGVAVGIGALAMYFSNEKAARSVIAVAQAAHPRAAIRVVSARSHLGRAWRVVVATVGVRRGDAAEQLQAFVYDRRTGIAHAVGQPINPGPSDAERTEPFLQGVSVHAGPKETWAVVVVSSHPDHLSTVREAIVYSIDQEGPPFQLGTIKMISGGDCE